MAEIPCTPDKTAVRLRAIHAHLGGTKKAFGDLLGVKPNQIQHLFRGKNLPTPAMLWALYQARAIPSEFVLFGIAKSLPDDHRDGILRAMRAAQDQFDRDTASPRRKERRSN